jgi:hypothetical protein
MQDFTYTFQRKALTVLSRENDGITRLRPEGPLTLTMRSQKTFNQDDKELERVNLEFPKMYRFTERFSFDQLVHIGDIDDSLYEDADDVFQKVPDATTVLQKYKLGRPVVVKTHDPHPEYVFILLQYQGDEGYNNNRPMDGIPITKCEIRIQGQLVRSISNLETNELLELTVRNSHHYASSGLYTHVGAVLLTKEDLADFNYFTGRETVDQLQLEVQLEFIWTQLNKTIPEQYSPAVRPSLVVNVCLFNHQVLEGEPHFARFKLSDTLLDNAEE